MRATKMSKPVVGKLLDKNKSYVRDAIHVPVVPVVASVKLHPGECIDFKEGVVFSSHKGIGIVDPFLNDDVSPGEKCYMFLKPGSVTKLWHDWTHPKLDKK